MYNELYWEKVSGPAVKRGSLTANKKKLVLMQSLADSY